MFNFDLSKDLSSKQHQPHQHNNNNKAIKDARVDRLRPPAGPGGCPRRRLGRKAAS